jgi:hypothetical protein
MRILPNWIESFIEYTDHLPSPPIFRKWGGIAAIAGALERKVWVRTLNMDLFPNLYTVMVAPPGIGKTIITATVEELWRSLTTHKVAPKSLTKASLIDSLADAHRTKTVISENSLHLDFHSLLVNAGELGVLIPAYDADFMNVLTDIYDGRQYEERRRGKDLHITIKRPQLNILAACTPSYLNGMLPEGAWDQGFLSRTFLIYSGERTTRDLFSEEEFSTDLLSKLKSDLRDVADIAGKMGFEPEARAALSAWHAAGGPPTPDHPKLTHYLTRRSAHLLKLCMVASIAESSNLVINLSHYQTALGWLLEMESKMPDIFKALGARGDGQVIEETWHYLYTIWAARKEPIHEHRLVGYLSEKVPSYSVQRIIDIMEGSGQIEKALTNAGAMGWKPLQKQFH